MALDYFVAKWKGECPKLGLWSKKVENMLTFHGFHRELRGLAYANNRIGSFNKLKKGIATNKQIQFVSEEALGKRFVSMALHYNGGAGKRKTR